LKKKSLKLNDWGIELGMGVNLVRWSWRGVNVGLNVTSQLSGFRHWSMMIEGNLGF